MQDDPIERFLSRYARERRANAALERLAEGATYFALERSGVSGPEATYSVLRHSPAQGAKKMNVPAPRLAEPLRKEIPFIPALLKAMGESDWADEAEAMYAPNPARTFVWDALLLPDRELGLQFDWRDATVPDGFKLGVKFKGEQKPTYYPLHNDVVASAVENMEPLLKSALAIVPEVFGRLLEADPDLLALWERAGLSSQSAEQPPPVPGRQVRL